VARPAEAGLMPIGPRQFFGWPLQGRMGDGPSIAKKHLLNPGLPSKGLTALLRFASRFLVLLAALQILGGHWAVLQTVAWTSMFIENARAEPLVEAFAKTFDGSRPCSLCVAVEKGKSEEEKEAPSKLIVKLEAILAPSVGVLPPPLVGRVSAVVAQIGTAMAGTPPTPPPRTV
jgi:hypothetical protein